ncbi:MAG: indolepyruvate ferredoxin oxidoreductase subunit alpha [Megasphaera massiliensis]|uniref:indolepyruvate ferredoxin oxidoreductase subunit alpha n=1 Tax=Megasphaera massiliensis TaxID=1232428 RepID=UPI002A76167B|nr:indolepyruvate ferredoxin oxidoreductase subunit alpha [Megasphaera massiliensis]MDY2965221.1 indolepyruvate ferredoxin oxidoreductase subunit alpha [Megasphaera massiliensis]
MRQLMTGDEAIARGVYEAGASFASAYPGTPSTEILENIAQYDEISSEWAPNEKVAMEAAIGASIGGVRSFAAMKMIGLNVAADPLFTFAYLGVNGGMVFVSADDPGMHSSQNEQDNRNYAKFAKIAMMEPSDSQEAKDMVAEAYEVSERYGTPVMIRMTTRVCHSKGLVQTADRHSFSAVPYVKQRDKMDPVPAISKVRRYVVEEREEKLKEYSEQTALNFEEMNDTKIGIITSGVSYNYCKEVFGDKASYLKLGFTYPLPLQKIRAFADKVDELYVVEELDPFMEDQIQKAGIACHGRDVIPGIDELNPNRIAKGILGESYTGVLVEPELIVDRPPALCAGCPHRGFFYELAKRKDTVMVGDIGCYALGGSEPLNAKDMALCMGSAFSLGHGLVRAFSKSGQAKRVVAVMGDSTFFHTGINALTEVSYNKSNTICVILDNRITGMTGHQENPGTGYTIKGEPTTTIDVEQVVQALGIQHVRTVNPNDLSDMKSTLDWAYSIEDEPVVIITKWPCILKKFSSEDKKEFNLDKVPCVIDKEKCIGCKKCLTTGCPALRFNLEEKKSEIVEVDCVGCKVCMQVCPVKAISRKGDQ